MSAQANALRAAGLNLLKAGQIDQAIATLQQAVRADPGSVDTWTYLGFAFTKQGNFEVARRAFGRAVQVDPQSAKGRYNLGMAHQMAGDVEAARICFQAAIGFDPNYEQAKAALEKLPAKEPDRPLTMAELASPGGAVRLPGAQRIAEEPPAEAAVRKVLTPEEMARLAAPQGHLHMMGAQADEADHGAQQES